MWHFPWSRNACGIYWSLWLYIPNNCMLFATFGLFAIFCCMTAQVQERGSVTTLTQCTCQTSAVTLYFSPWLFTHLSTLWHFRWDAPLCAAYPPHWFSLIHVTTSLPHRSSVAAWTAILLPDGAIVHYRLARCSFSGRLCHFKNSKHPLNASQTACIVSAEWKIAFYKWLQLNSYIAWSLCSRNDSF